MATNEGSMLVRLGIDITRFTNGIRNATSQLVTFSRNASSLHQPVVSSMNTAGRAVNQFSSDARRTGNNISTAFTPASNITNPINESLENTQSTVDSFERNTERTGRNLGDSFSPSEDIGRPIEDSLGRTTQSMQRFGSNIQQTGQNLSNAFAPAAATSGIWLGRMINDSRNFEEQTRRAAVLTGGSYQQVKSAILDMAKSSVYSTGEVAAAFAEMGAKGFDAAKATDALPGVLSAAAASGEGLGLVADTITSALNAFNMEASESNHVADVLAQGANQSAASVYDMNYAFKYAAPVASQLGISMEELAAATGIMADAGIKGEQAGTTLRASFLRLVDPPKAAAEALEELGVEVKGENGEMKSLAQIVGELGKSMNGMTDAQKAAYLSTIFGTEAVSGMLSLMAAGPTEIEKMTKSLENSGGASKKAADDMLEGWAGAMTKMESSIDVASRSFTDALAPAVTGVAKVIKFLSDAFSSLPGPTKSIIAGVTALSIAILVVGTVFGFMLNAIGGGILMIGKLTTVFSGVARITSVTHKAFGLLRIAFTALTGPIGIIIAVVSALVAIFIHLYKTNEEFREAVQVVWEAIKLIISSVIEFIAGFIQEILGGVLKFWKENQDSIKEATSNAWDFIKGIIQGVMTVIQAIFSVVWPILKFIVVDTWESIKGVVQGALKFIQGIIQVFSGLFTGDFGLMWEGIKNIFSGAVQFIWNLVNLVFVGKILKLGKVLFSGLTNIVKVGWDAIKNIFSFVLQAIKSLVSMHFNAIKFIITTVVNIIKSVINVGFTTMKNIVGKLTSGTKEVIEKGWNKAVEFLKGINLVDIGKNIIKGLVNGIKSMIGAVADAVKNIASTVTDGLKGALGIHSPSRVMRDEIGRWLPPGVADGVLDGLSTVKDATKKLSQAMIPDTSNLSLAYSVPNVSSNADEILSDVGFSDSDLNDKNDNVGLTVIIEEMNVRDEQDIHDISRELYDLSERSNKSKGRR